MNVSTKITNVLTMIEITFVQTLMNAGMEQIYAAGTRVALTHRAHTPVAVIQVSMVMECHVVIQMSVHKVYMTVIPKQCALIVGDHISVPV